MRLYTQLFLMWCLLLLGHTWDSIKKHLYVPSRISRRETWKPTAHLSSRQCAVSRFTLKTLNTVLTSFWFTQNFNSNYMEEGTTILYFVISSSITYVKKRHILTVIKYEENNRISYQNKLITRKKQVKHCPP